MNWESPADITNRSFLPADPALDGGKKNVLPFPRNEDRAFSPGENTARNGPEQEVPQNPWFSNLLMPGAGGLLIAGPVGGVAAAGTASIVAIDYQMKLSKRIRELVNQHSQKDLTYDNVEHMW
jgi:hypothetical protein